MFIYYVLMKPYSWWIRINCRFLALPLGFGAKWNSCHLRTIRKKLRVCFSFTFECKRILLHWGKHCGWQQKWGRSALWWEHYLLTGDFFKGAVISCDLTKSVLCVFFLVFPFFFYFRSTWKMLLILLGVLLLHLIILILLIVSTAASVSVFFFIIIISNCSWVMKIEMHNCW